MRWSRSLAKGRAPLRRAGLMLAVLLTLTLTGPAAEERRLYIFAASARYQVAVVEHEGKEYVGLTELLQPLGEVSGRVDGRKFKYRFKGRRHRRLLKDSCCRDYSKVGTGFRCFPRLRTPALHAIR